MSDKFTREIIFYPSWDKRHPEPHKNYGVHGVDLLFLLKGQRGVIQWRLFTGWMLKSLRKENPDWYGFGKEPMPADLGYHSPVPKYKNQPMLMNDCNVLGGRPCYYDSSTSNAESVFEALISGGSDAIWAELEKYYNEIFELGGSGE